MSDGSETPGRAMRAIAEWRGMFRLAGWAGGISVPIMTAAIGFVNGKVAEASEVNRVQAVEIDQIRARASEDRADTRRMVEEIKTQLEKIADRVGATR